MTEYNLINYIQNILSNFLFGIYFIMDQFILF